MYQTLIETIDWVITSGPFCATSPTRLPHKTAAHPERKSRPVVSRW